MQAAVAQRLVSDNLGPTPSRENESPVCLLSYGKHSVQEEQKKKRETHSWKGKEVVDSFWFWDEICRQCQLLIDLLQVFNAFCQNHQCGSGTRNFVHHQNRLSRAPQTRNLQFTEEQKNRVLFYFYGNVLNKVDKKIKTKCCLTVMH